jgi:hypothetical protein
MNAGESIFTQSRVNNYDEDELPQQNWQWPRGTWFQTRLDCLRERDSALGKRAVRHKRERIERGSLCDN